GTVGGNVTISDPEEQNQILQIETSYAISEGVYGDWVVAAELPGDFSGEIKFEEFLGQRRFYEGELLRAITRQNV
ncbi:MAG: hypothetical protein ACNA7X_02115, partial [Dehalococcoidia bacterium]